MTDDSKLDPTSRTRWRGLVSLVVDAVTQGSAAVERVQLETAARPFGILEQIPPLAPVTKVVHVIHDTTVAGVHGTIRLVTRAVGGTVKLAIDLTKDAPDAPDVPVSKAETPAGGR